MLLVQFIGTTEGVLALYGSATKQVKIHSNCYLMGHLSTT